MPEKDIHEIGHKYPFNACEILCSENGISVVKFLNTKPEKKEETLPKPKSESPKKEDTGSSEENQGDDESSINEVDKIKTQEKKKEEGIKVEGEGEKEKEIKELETEKEDDKKEEEKKQTEEKETPKEVENKPGESEEKKEEEPKGGQQKGKEKEEVEDDFELEENENQYNNIPLVKEIYNYILSFLDTPTSEDDYVLVGYFNKIVNSLLKEKVELFLDHIFDSDPPILKKFFNHISRKAIGNTLDTIASSINDAYENLDKDKRLEKRTKYITDFCSYLLDSLLNDKIDALGVEVICDVLINSIITSNKFNFIIFLTTQDLMDKTKVAVDKIIKSNENSKIATLIKLLVKANEIIIKDYDGKVTPSFVNNEAENEINTLISISRGTHDQLRYPSLSDDDLNIISKYFNKVIEFEMAMTQIIIKDIVNTESAKETEFTNSLYDSKQKRLGMKALSEWEFFRTVMDIVTNANDKPDTKEQVKEIIDVISKSDIFKKFIATFFEFNFNNMFQIIFTQISQIISNSSAPEQLVEGMLKAEYNNRKFIDAIIYDIVEHHIIQHEKIKQEKKNEMNSPLFAIEIDILENFRQSSNGKLKEFMKEKEEEFFIDEVISELYKLFKTNLMKNNSSESRVNFYGDDSEDHIPFSKRTFEEMIKFRLKVYSTFLKEGDYKKLIKEEEEALKRLDMNNDEENANSRNDSENSESLNQPLINDVIEENIDNSRNAIGGNREEQLARETHDENEEQKNENSYQENNYWSVPIMKKGNDDWLKEAEL